MMTEETEAIVRGYLDAIAFTGAWIEGKSELLVDFDETQFHPSTIERVRKDCAKFENVVTPSVIEQWVSEDPWRSLEDVGIVFWYTRNGDSTGFWESDTEAAKVLDEASKNFGSCHALVFENQVHLD